MLQRFFVAVMAGSCVVLAGCASPGVRSGSTAVNALYAQLDQASKNYEAALAQADSGQSEKSGKTMDQALDQLRDAAARCGKTPGCDMQRFVSTYDHLLHTDSGDVAVEQDVDDTAESDLPVNQVVPQTQRTVTLLHGHKLSDLIAMNGPVKSALEEWLTWRRPQLMRSYVNYEYLRHLMWPKFKKAGLPEAILFGLVTKESGGKVHAVSRSNAKGPLQFMYATGARFGLHTVDGFDQRFDPAMSAGAAAEYIDEQLKVFNDNLELVLAAYNGGEGRVGRLVDGKTVSFYDPQIYFSLPEQTRRYVPLVLAASWLFLHPDSYHLKFPKIKVVPGQIKLVRQASLSELSICLGQDENMRDGWFRTLRNLNPRLNPQDELAPGTLLHVPRKLEAAYARDCTDGPWPILAADLHSGTVPAPQPSGLPRHYVVHSGDTLSGIVSRLGCSSVREVARMNHLRRPHYAIRVGQRLTLPRCY
ncbi:MAG TPA: transglycosylase SLT domain-containing protein [Oleiagrimonas sp.]|nr:transglycosylase SLT domain-containing protein [Oleiagrimonas sp.]